MDLDSALSDKPAEGASATDILRADHDAVRELFGDYARAAAGSHARRVVMQAICMQVELHDRIEREVFYPALAALAPELSEAAIAEHDELMTLIAALRERSDCDAQCDADVATLRELLERHLSEEERSMFPRIERRGAESLRELGVALVKCKEAATRATGEFESPST